MSNKAKPRKHGMVMANTLRPKTKIRKRKNKATASVLQKERQSALQAAIVRSGK